MNVRIITISVLLATTAVSGQENEQRLHGFGQEGDENEKHIRMHLEGAIDSAKAMDKADKEFLYFRMYDMNSDGYLDGVEIAKSVIHHQHCTNTFRGCVPMQPRVVYCVLLYTFPLGCTKENSLWWRNCSQSCNSVKNNHSLKSDNSNRGTLSENEIEKVVDQLISEKDMDGDGLISYAEYVYKK